MPGEYRLVSLLMKVRSDLRGPAQELPRQICTNTCGRAAQRCRRSIAHRQPLAATEQPSAAANGCSIASRLASDDLQRCHRSKGVACGAAGPSAGPDADSAEAAPSSAAAEPSGRQNEGEVLETGEV